MKTKTTPKTPIISAELKQAHKLIEEQSTAMLNLMHAHSNLKNSFKMLKEAHEATKQRLDKIIESHLNVTTKWK